MTLKFKFLHLNIMLSHAQGVLHILHEDYLSFKSIKPSNKRLLLCLIPKEVKMGYGPELGFLAEITFLRKFIWLFLPQVSPSSLKEPNRLSHSLAQVNLKSFSAIRITCLDYLYIICDCLVFTHDSFRYCNCLKI